MYVRFYVMTALLFHAMRLYAILVFTMYVFYEICFVRNDEINKLLLILLIEPVGTKSSEILIEIQTFSLKSLNLGLNVLS